MKATPRPWKSFIKGRTVAILDSNGQEIISWMGFDASKFPLVVQAANARLIVKSVNEAAERARIEGEKDAD